MANYWWQEGFSFGLSPVTFPPGATRWDLKFKAYLESLETLKDIKNLVVRTNTPHGDNFYANKARYREHIELI